MGVQNIEGKLRIIGETRDSAVLSWDDILQADCYLVEGLLELFTYEEIEMVDDICFTVDLNRCHYNGYRVVFLAQDDDGGFVPIGCTETVMHVNHRKHIDVRLLDAPGSMVSAAFLSDECYDLYRIVCARRVHCETKDCVVLLEKGFLFHVEAYRHTASGYELAAVSYDVSTDKRDTCTMDSFDDRAHPVISVIVPVYNSKMFLVRAVQSILSSSFPGLEVILVDDGSDVFTAGICDWYVEHYSCVKAYHRGRFGVCASRNFGMSVANGEWIAFVDHDDIVHPYMYYKLIMTARRDPKKKYDVVIGQCIKQREDGTACCLVAPGIGTGTVEMDSFGDVLAAIGGNNNIYFCAVWNRIVRADLAGKVQFVEDRPYYEDEAYTMALYSYAENFLFVGDAYYVWDRRLKQTKGTTSVTQYDMHAWQLWRYWILSCASCLFYGNPDENVAEIYRYYILKKLLSKYRECNIGKNESSLKNVYRGITRYLVQKYDLPVNELAASDSDLVAVWLEVDRGGGIIWDGFDSVPEGLL